MDGTPTSLLFYLGIRSEELRALRAAIIIANCKWQMTNLGKYQKVQLVITAFSGNPSASKNQLQPF